ncbi:uncharacterized protein LOC115633904 [Scaptodrosophila lebanonensis]|uniref:Uncharacterized protein LOC115633904 n=1 Tax=Drosophila lebanonensis TaxID=7225 RepID=A0A6J2UIE3_DROLE|nr:uncharacterized protein LOC115633904 [Scaptodrosophila lebanonensis]
MNQSYNQQNYYYSQHQNQQQQHLRQQHNQQQQHHQQQQFQGNQAHLYSRREQSNAPVGISQFCEEYRKIYMKVLDLGYSPDHALQKVLDVAPRQTHQDILRSLRGEQEIEPNFSERNFDEQRKRAANFGDRNDAKRWRPPEASTSQSRGIWQERGNRTTGNGGIGAHPARNPMETPIKPAIIPSSRAPKKARLANPERPIPEPVPPPARVPSPARVDITKKQPVVGPSKLTHMRKPVEKAPPPSMKPSPVRPHAQQRTHTAAANPTRRPLPAAASNPKPPPVTGPTRRPLPSSASTRTLLSVPLAPSKPTTAQTNQPITARPGTRIESQSDANANEFLPKMSLEDRMAHIQQILTMRSWSSKRKRRHRANVKIFMNMGFSQAVAEPMAVEFGRINFKMKSDFLDEIGVPSAARETIKENISNGQEDIKNVAMALESYPKKKLSTAQMELIENTLVEELSKEESSTFLRFDGIFYKAGYMVIKCIGRRPRSWMYSKVSKLNVVIPDGKLKIWNEENLPKRYIVTFILPKGDKVDPKTTLALLGKQNFGLNIEDWDIFESENQGNDKCFKVGIDEKSMQAIEARNLKLNYRLELIEIKVLMNSNDPNWDTMESKLTETGASKAISSQNNVDGNSAGNNDNSVPSSKTVNIAKGTEKNPSTASVGKSAANTAATASTPVTSKKPESIPKEVPNSDAAPKNNLNLSIVKIEPVDAT